MSASINSKEYRFGVDYEVVRELINGEVAHHFAQLYELGKDSMLGVLHHKSIEALKQIRDTLNPNDPETVRIALLAIDAMQADREHVVSLTAPSEEFQTSYTHSIARRSFATAQAATA